MTKSQFDQAVARHGFKPVGFFGYYNLPEPCRAVSVSVFNAGRNRRAQLAYLLKSFDEQKTKREVKP